MATRKFKIEIEVELSVDVVDYGLGLGEDVYISNDGWAYVNDFNTAIEALQYEYGHTYIKRVGNPRIVSE
jgi:hypothetical protein